MEIEVKGHSGCDIEVVREESGMYVYKSTYDPHYFDRLERQAQKQLEAAIPEYQHIRVPRIHNIERTNDAVRVKMDYVYSRNFVEFFEQAGFEQIEYLVKSLVKYIECEINDSPIIIVKGETLSDKFAAIKDKLNITLPYLCESDYTRVNDIMRASEQILCNIKEMELPVGKCHGDLTFSNILFNGNNYYLIDFLDSFIESPIMDIVKLRQDTAWSWSKLMYTKPCDEIRLNIVFEKIDNHIHNYFSEKYSWYNKYYKPLQLLNFLRILQYAREPKVIEYLILNINEQLRTF